MWPLLLLFLITELARISPGDVLKQASAEALQGNHQKVVDLLYPMLYPTSQMATRTQEIEAHRLLGTAYWFLGRRVEAAQEFTAILNLNPEFQLDPLVVPPGLISFFEKVRRDLSSRLEEIRRRRQEEERRRRMEEERRRREQMRRLMKEAPVMHETVTIREHIFIFNFFPFGVGQFQNGQSSKGWVLAMTQLLAAGVSLGSWYYLQYRYPDGLVPHDEVSLARTIQYVQVGSGVVFWGLWALSAADALWNYTPTSKSVKKKIVPKIAISPANGGIMGSMTWQW